jgi:hypothetical protein
MLAFRKDRLARTKIDSACKFIQMSKFIGFGVFPRVPFEKLKTKKTEELTFDEASKVIDLFKAGDLRTVQGVMAWSPPARTHLVAAGKKR